MSAAQIPQSPQCWDRACDCFATAKIFEKRALSYRKKLDWISYLGIGVPALFGAMVAAWGKDVVDNGYLMFIVAALGVAQVGLSVAALIHRWPDEYAYANRSAATNFQLSDEFKTLAPQALNPSHTFQSDLARLISRDQTQTQLDTEKHVTDSEKSWGHRHALRQFKRQCAVCNMVPTDMKPTNCNLCGGFK